MSQFLAHGTAHPSGQQLVPDKAAHARLKRQIPFVIWLTGLSGAGKSTIASLVQSRLHALGRHTYLLDGDDLRRGLNRDLGFSDADRSENIRRTAEVARILVDAGLIVIAAFISPFCAQRRMARERFEPHEFVEVFVDAPLETVEKRDPKGLYRRARAGLLPNFTGIDSPYEAPDAPDIHIRTAEASPEQCADQLIASLYRQHKLVD